jgi:serine/threonine protein kinase
MHVFFCLSSFALKLGTMKEIPSSWPLEARQLYNPLKPLGTGGFGTVWLAESTSEGSKTQHEGERQVAIKIVGHPSSKKTTAFAKMSESGYFHREVEVLQEISHHRIVKLLHKIEETEDEKKNTPEASPFCMVLAYCRGPTLEQILKHGGAPGIYLAREIGRFAHSLFCVSIISTCTRTKLTECLACS